MPELPRRHCRGGIHSGLWASDHARIDESGRCIQWQHPAITSVQPGAPLKDNIDLVATLAPWQDRRQNRSDEADRRKHGVHVVPQSARASERYYISKFSSEGQFQWSALPACHDPTRQMSGQVNPLADWATSAHAQSTGKISRQALLGSYTTVAAAACISCHAPHNAVGMARLLRGQNEQACIACHNGSNISPLAPYANVFSEYAKPKIGHPFPASSNLHDAGEKTLLNNNRHATCMDCHNAHGSVAVGVFPPPPLIRVSQKDVAGISANRRNQRADAGHHQYENCLAAMAAAQASKCGRFMGTSRYGRSRRAML